MNAPESRIRFLREDDSVLSAARAVGRREIETIHERQRNVIAADKRICHRERAFLGWAAPRQSVERRFAVDQEIVAVRGIGGDASGFGVLSIEELLVEA